MSIKFSMRSFQLQFISTSSLLAKATLLGLEEADIGAKVGNEVGKRPRLIIERNVDVSRPDLGLQGPEPAAGRIEPFRLLHIGRAHQLALEIVDPAVIWAHEFLDVAVAVRHFHAAVAADVHEAIVVSVLVLRHENGLAEDTKRQVIAGLLKLLHPPDAEPILHQYLFFFELEHLSGTIHVAGRVLRAVQRRKYARQILACFMGAQRMETSAIVAFSLMLRFSESGACGAKIPSLESP